MKQINYPILDHIAILVPSLEKSIVPFEKLKLEIGAINHFEGEGTAEVYIGSDDLLGRVLLLEAIGAGPYQKATLKRGCGIHHLAFNVENINSFLQTLEGSGLLMHPKSLDYFQTAKTIWLCRPGIPFLIEIHESNRVGEKLFDSISLDCGNMSDFALSLFAGQIKRGPLALYSTKFSGPVTL